MWWTTACVSIRLHNRRWNKQPTHKVVCPVPQLISEVFIRRAINTPSGTDYARLSHNIDYPSPAEPSLFQAEYTKCSSILPSLVSLTWLLRCVLMYLFWQWCHVLCYYCIDICNLPSLLTSHLAMRFYWFQDVVQRKKLNGQQYLSVIWFVIPVVSL